jgi:hypothetical protein
LRVTTLVIAAVLAGACGGSGPASQASGTSPASHARSTSTPSPVPSNAAFAVVATRVGADPYGISLVAVDGRVVASAQASWPGWPAGCGSIGTGPDIPMPVSTSNTRAYFMDAAGVIRYLSPNGDTGRATTVVLGPSRYSMFSVSPDDTRIAVVVGDYTPGTVALRLYVEDLNGGANHLDIFSSTGAYGLWPVGWHGGSLVVAKVHACTSGGGPFCCSMLELHVVDPTTAARQYALGGPQCVLVGSPSPAGAICEDAAYSRASVLDWTGAVSRSFPIQGPTPAMLAPDGSRAALNVDAHTTAFDPASTSLSLYACGWIDSTHVIAGGAQPQIGEVTTGKTVSVQAPDGGCARGAFQGACRPPGAHANSPNNPFAVRPVDREDTVM